MTVGEKCNVAFFATNLRDNSVRSGSHVIDCLAVRTRVSPDAPIRNLFPCPNGETINEVASRADRVISQVRSEEGNVALFSHGHLLRVLAVRWLGFEPAYGRYFQLGTRTLSILAFDGATPRIKTLNRPLLTAACAVPSGHGSDS